MVNTVQLFVRKNLSLWAEPEFARFSSALIPRLSCPMWGVRLPKLRAFAKSLVQEYEPEILLQSLVPDTFEEVMLRGFVLGYAAMPWDCRWQQIQQFVSLIDNWSVCDSCCATYKEVRRHRAEVWTDLVQFLRSHEEFKQRFAVVMMMDHYLIESYISRVLQVWKEMEPHGYYVEMAVGWGLSVAFLKFPEQTFTLLQNMEVSLACRKNACQKILESRRTPENWRPKIKQLRADLATVKNNLMHS